MGRAVLGMFEVVVGTGGYWRLGRVLVQLGEEKVMEVAGRRV
jgi:hypothetical protein